MDASLSKIYTLSEAFAYLIARGAPLKSENSIYQLTHRRLIGHHKRGRQLRFCQQDLDDYLVSITGPYIPPKKLIEGSKTVNEGSKAVNED